MVKRMSKHVMLFLLALATVAVVAPRVYLRHDAKKENVKEVQRAPLVLRAKDITIGGLSLGLPSEKVLELKGTPSEKIPTGSPDIESWDWEPPGRTVLLEKGRVTQILDDAPLELPNMRLETGITLAEFRSLTGFSEDQMPEPGARGSTSVAIEGGTLSVGIPDDKIESYGVWTDNNPASSSKKAGR